MMSNSEFRRNKVSVFGVRMAFKIKLINHCKSLLGPGVELCNISVADF